MSPAPSSASDYFGGMRESYDSLIRRAIPAYDEMLRMLLRFLPPSPRRILELGCGTGNLTVPLVARYPETPLTCVDASEEMLVITSNRLAEAGRTRDLYLIASTFESLTPSLGAFDLVVSSISIHHVADKALLYRTLYDVIDPGGTFRWADQTRGANEAIHAVHWSDWLAWCRQPGNCSEEEIESLLDHARAHDHYTSLPEHFTLLTGAGFAPVDCVWRDNMWAVVIADKP